MFQVRKRETTFRKVLTFCDLVYHNIVRTIRKTHGNALMSIVMNLMQMIIFVLAFYFMFSILGLRGAVLRGDFMVYIMTGIFLFMTHIKTVGAVAGSEGPASPMMKRAYEYFDFYRRRRSNAALHSDAFALCNHVRISRVGHAL